MQKSFLIFSVSLLVGPAINALAQGTNQVVTNSLTQTNLSLRCISNLKQIWLDYRNWAERHEGRFPFNVTTNAGGSKELSSHGDDRIEKNPAAQLRNLAKGLVGYDYGTFTPKILVCPADTNRMPAANFLDLGFSNVTYELFCCTNTLGDTPPGILLHCSIHNWTLWTDGTIHERALAK
jgi:hypothetical protein